MRHVGFCIIFLLLPTIVWCGPLRLAYDHYPPFEYGSDRGVAGRNAELIDVICQRLGIELEYLEIPFARALYDAEYGKIDGIFSLFRTAERERFLYYADEPLGETETAIVTKTGSGIDWNGLESLKDYAIGCVRGYFHGDEVDSMLGLNVTKVKDNNLLVKMLGSGRIDIAICNLDVMQYTHDMRECDWQIVVLKRLVRKPLYIGFSRKLGEQGRRLAEEFSDEIRKTKCERPNRD